jgi:hypothetical protein
MFKKTARLTAALAALAALSTPAFAVITMTDQT